MRRSLLLAACAFIAAAVACGGGSNPTPTAHNAPTLTSIQISGANHSLAPGQIQPLKAIASYTDGKTQDVTSSAKWDSSDSTVAAVAAGGIVTTQASGTCTISAKVGAVSGSLSLAVGITLVSIAVTPANPAIALGTAEQFLASGTYSDNSTQDLTTQVTWTSSNTSIATVSASASSLGMTIGIGAGSTTITATMGSISGSTSLTVTAATPVSIAIDPSNPPIALYVSQQFTATATFSDHTMQDVTNVAQWQSSDANIASITASGLVTGRALGSSTVSASFGGIGAKTLLTVKATSVSSIAITPANGSGAQGVQQAFTAIGTYNDGSTHDLTGAVTWSSSDSTVLSFGSIKGWAQGIAPGQVNVTAELGFVSASAPFTVTDATIVSVVVSPNGVTMPTGARTVYSATGLFSDSSSQVLSGSAVWNSDNASVAPVTALFENYGAAAVGMSAGTANVSAKFSYAGATATGSSQLTVSSATLQSLSLSPNTASVTPGSGVWLAANATFSDGTTQVLNPLCTWTSSDPSVATVASSGQVTGQSAGMATIKAQDGPVSATASVLVQDGALSSIQVTPQSATVPVGFWTQFLATGKYSNGGTINLTGFANWTSSNSSVATISNGLGHATGVQPGTTTISAVYGGQVGTATLTVTNATLTAITVTPSSVSIAVGSTKAFTAQGKFSDGSTMNLTSQVTWSSSTPSVATVAADGGAQALRSGTTTISASVGSVAGSAVLAVQ